MIYMEQIFRNRFNFLLDEMGRGQDETIQVDRSTVLYKSSLSNFKCAYPRSLTIQFLFHILSIF